MAQGLPVVNELASADSTSGRRKFMRPRNSTTEPIARTVDPGNVIAGMLEICRNRIRAFD